MLAYANFEQCWTMMTMTDDVGHALGKIREYLTMHVDMMDCTIDIGTGLFISVNILYVYRFAQYNLDQKLQLVYYS
jgi:hypothetical protein